MHQSSLTIVTHPLIQHKLTELRRKETPSYDFRRLVKEITLLLGYEATRHLPLLDVEIETPVAPMTGKVLQGGAVALVPILRAGLGFLDGMLELLPTARVGHIGLYRDHESLESVEYYCKLPEDIATREVIILDPMLTTGNSSAAAITLVKKTGAKKITFLSLVSAPEGVRRVHEEHPEVHIVTASLDQRLNEHGYIVPGLGDAGDRLFGTK